MKRSTQLGKATITALRGELRGRTILPDESGFAAARRVWNAAIDRQPLGIAVCADAEDVAIAVRIAASHDVAVTVRGGGHNVAGRSIRDDALLIDLSCLRSVVVNAETRIANVQGGALWHDVDAATAEEGLATTGGLVSSTGVGGFTLGGGAGWLMRRHGLASDNLVGANVVLADGRIVHASLEDDAELFWGLRGGTGGFGVVTSFEFQLHPLREVLAGLVIYPADQARSMLAAFRDFAVQAPDEFCGLAVLLNAPPLPFLESAWHRRPVLMLALCWCGDPARGVAALAPLRHSGSPLAETVAPVPYVDWQQMQDPGAPAGRYHYWKTANYTALDDSTLDILADAALHLPTGETEFHVQHFGGAVARQPLEESAFAHRDAQFFVNLMGITANGCCFEELRTRMRQLHERITSHALPGILPNFASLEDTGPVQQFGTSHAGRLAALRNRCDPQGRFSGGSSC
jgi:FAD/FMN-containing dehydrogenase